MKVDLEELSKIRQVETPPFLFTRIEEKIAQTKMEKISPLASFGISAAFVLVLLVNAFVLINNDDQKSQTETYVESMNLLNNNTLYR